MESLIAFIISQKYYIFVSNKSYWRVLRPKQDSSSPETNEYQIKDSP